MHAHPLSKRLRIELNILSCVRDALRVALDAPLDDELREEWIERLRFLMSSFNRHLERLFAVEEEHGYMDILTQSPQPTLCQQADRLLAEHLRFRREILELRRDAEGLDSENLASYQSLRQRVHGFLIRVEHHRHREQELLLEAFLGDIGGEG